MLKFLRLTGLVLVFLYLPQVVRAQVLNLVNVSTPNTEDFPVVSSYLEIRDEEGGFVSDLKAGDVTVLENDQPIVLDEFTELEPGVQFVLAINPGTTFAPQDSQGKSRYNDLVEALAKWAVAKNGKQTDDLSLIANGVEDVIHLSDRMDWLDALYAAPSDHRSATPNLQILSRAIGIAASSPSEPGVEQVVLLITPNPTQQEITSLESLGEQARSYGVRLFVWMVSPESYFTTQGAVTLQDIAFSTGGKFFAYSGAEAIPDLELYLEPLRHIYFLTYTSKITTQGEHSFAVEVNTSDYQATSAAQTFPLDILPPNPILVSPPGDVYRSALTDPRTNQLTGYTNESQSLEILIEFPDGYERTLARTTLYVNGKIADENTQPPFEHFTWNLGEVIESGKFELQVEAVDALGLSSISLPNTVNVTVQQLPQGFAAEISRQGSIVSAAVVLVSGTVLILVLVMVIRRKHDPNATGKWRKRKARKNGYKGEDTIPLPGLARSVQRKSVTGWAKQFPWMNQQNRIRKPEPVAFLERVYDPNSLEALTPVQPIPILNNVITVGNDPTKATLVLEEPSIAAQHARLRRDREGNFFILDHGTVAGTWINYSQANGKEIRIEHGDLIHLGRVGFRFQIKNPPQVFEPLVVFEQNGKNGNGHV